MVRTHGFERPLDPHQVGSWIAFGLFAVAFFVIYTPVHTDAAGIVCSALYVILGLATILSGLWVMRTDPADPGLVAKLAAERTGTDFPPVSAEAVNYCYLCEVNVRKRSKHCRRCNKCVDIFDHHCPWLNTCVGVRNYRYFLSLLVSSFSLTMLQMATALHAGIRLATQRDEAVSALHLVYSGVSELAYGLLQIFSFVAVLLAWLMILQLLTFHIALMYRGITTYEFIISQRNREKERDAQRGPDYVPTWRDRLNGWIDRNAPCLAVCEVCEARPPSARASTSKESSKKPGRIARQASDSKAGSTPPPSSTMYEGAPEAAASHALEMLPVPIVLPEPALEIDLHADISSSEPPSAEPRSAEAPATARSSDEELNAEPPETFDDEDESEAEPPSDAAAAPAAASASAPQAELT